MRTPPSPRLQRRARNHVAPSRNPARHLRHVLSSRTARPFGPQCPAAPPHKPRADRVVSVPMAGAPPYARLRAHSRVLPAGQDVGQGVLAGRDTQEGCPARWRRIFRGVGCPRGRCYAPAGGKQPQQPYLSEGIKRRRLSVVCVHGSGVAGCEWASTFQDGLPPA